MTDLDIAARAETDLHDPALYQNRELSWLEFNRRVLHEALDPRTPLLERVKFLAIFASNLDEFFQVRVAGVREQVAARVHEYTPDRLAPPQQLVAIRETVRGMVDQHSRCLMQDLLPGLAAEGIRIHDRWEALPEREQAHLSAYFAANVFPVLTPLAVDPGHPFPHISNLSLSLAVTLRGADGETRFARVKVPKLLPRWVPLLSAREYLPLEYLIGAHLQALFHGVDILGWHLFRITRNSDLNIDVGQGDNDEADDLLDLIQEEVRNRKFGEVVRLEVHRSMPEQVRQLLLEEFNEAHAGEGLPLTPDDVFEVHGLLDGSDLGAIAALDLPALKDAPFTPRTPPRLAQGRDIFAAIRDGDILLHHPYDSFQTSVERLIAAAAEDPDVLAIKITLYRTGGEIARLLAQAAERGKQVAVLIELQARFDEEANISWAKRFEDIGVHVSYGVAELKTHAKVLLVVRREGDAIRRYVHVGTGNYNPRTARMYTDFGLLTCDEEIGADLSDLFNVLTGFGVPAGYRKLVVAPRWMKDRFLALIAREAEHARAGRSARILAKMNAIVDPDIIEALYAASRAGVQIDLIVRGICCLRPGIPGVSERIRVVSLLGRFLEHSRAMLFRNGGREEVFISSADWMPRNLDRRVEAAVPIEDPRHRAELRRWLELMLNDRRQGWEMQPDGSYVQRTPGPGDDARGTHAVLVR
ncbi:MAG: polyphosphate kinase 1 [Gemmatimonadetes bacterium HGW-Gemmatimonadetes-1]|jgi:polyphosphate kinase|nr:MAG: polyphosphate kinase 1 [Gemmatimonadetes bacterium HGW-Gemmatimonadetes-1]